ncbi:Major facilitator super domain-containing protein 7, partial [Irineochytrium annulatum]
MSVAGIIAPAAEPTPSDNAVPVRKPEPSSEVIAPTSDEKKSSTPIPPAGAESDAPVIALSRFRYMVLACIFLANLGNAVVWASYASITKDAAAYYGTSNNMINTISLVYLVIFIPAMWPSSWLLDTHGLRPTVLVGVWGTAIGALVRFLGGFMAPSSGGLALLWIGQMIAGISQPFVLE